ncbi:MAG: hypothetical protein KJO66_04165, partial [Gammaproteobacteria bacterium]|nr:hypothetical protein [Gammaproteobacteria bacterium]
MSRNALPLFPESGASHGVRLILAVRALVLLMVAATSCLAVLPAEAQENRRCLRCHSDDELTGFKGDDEISMYVDEDRYAASMHGDMECITCHVDLEGTRRRHPEDVEPVDCSVCHEAAQAEIDASLHGLAAAQGDEMAPTCADCHTSHYVQPADHPEAATSVMNVPLTCGRCHREGSPVSRTHEISKDHILENYSMSMHGEALYEKGLTVTAVCTSCHTGHHVLPHEDPRSSIHPDNVGAMCESCHGQIEEVHRKVIEGRLWREEPEKIPVCVDCHAPHKVRNVFYPDGLANNDCLICHSDPDLTMVRDGETVSLTVDGDAHAASVHGETSCAQCHTDVTVAQERACATISAPVDCSICHAEQVTEFTTTMHGSLHAEGDPDAPSCQVCHQKHATQSKEDSDSPTFARNVPILCGKCHRAGEAAAMRIDSEVPDIVTSYDESIHGRGLVQSGLLVTATCADCHGAHSELPPEDPRALIHPDNIAGTCGNCHDGIETALRGSIHWPGNGESEQDKPTCNDCHSSHTIGRIDRIGFRDQVMDQCGSCHEDETVTFFDTFHGKVSRLGGEAVAKCHDCHGAHNILPPEQPASLLSRDNVVGTCGQCHEGSHRRFAGYLTHATHHDSDQYPWLFWSFWGMTFLLIGTLSFALLHTLAWLIRLLLNRDEWRAHKEMARSGKEKMYRRFTRYQRTMHI